MVCRNSADRNSFSKLKTNLPPNSCYVLEVWNTLLKDTECCAMGRSRVFEEPLQEVSFRELESWTFKEKLCKLCLFLLASQLGQILCCSMTVHVLSFWNASSLWLVAAAVTGKLSWILCAYRKWWKIEGLQNHQQNGRHPVAFFSFQNSLRMDDQNWYMVTVHFICFFFHFSANMKIKHLRKC